MSPIAARTAWLACLIALTACSSEEEVPVGDSTSGGDQGAEASGGGASGGDEGSGGDDASGGTPTTGGDDVTGGTAATGGDDATGGATASGGDDASGGATASGGDDATGGATASGGDDATGGAAASGGDDTTGGTAASGGDDASGGSATSGGMAAAGGAATSGGMVASGGATASGGMAASGGAAASGGMVASGGATASGGMAASGGAAASGGMAASGGATASGGMAASGGAAASGGMTASGGLLGSGGSLGDFCAGGGPIVRIPDNITQLDGGTCTGTVARRLFDQAICTCDDVVFNGYLKTSSFSSDNDWSTFLDYGAPIGVNGRMNASGYVNAGGTMRVHNQGFFDITTFNGYVNVAGDLEFNGPVTVLGQMTVLRDGKFTGDVGVTSGSIGRDLYTQNNWLGLPQTEPPAWFAVGGTRIREPLTLDEPCECGRDELLDVSAIVRDGRTHNDNTTVGISPSELSGHVGFRQLTLPCGRFYVDEISGVGDIELHVTGRTALFVGGNVSLTGRFDVVLEPGAELDLFIGGNLVQIGYGTLGDTSRPSDMRIYVGGRGDILFRGYQPIGANLYAPRSLLRSDGYIDAYGSIFVRDLVSNAYIDVKYDSDILEVGDDEDCEPPPDTCETCDGSCGSQACLDGLCQPCQFDSDCCEPTICFEGECRHIPR